MAHLASGVETIHERQERGDDGGVDLVLSGGPHGRQPVNLVEEDDRGTHLVGLQGGRGLYRMGAAIKDYELGMVC